MLWASYQSAWASTSNNQGGLIAVNLNSATATPDYYFYIICVTATDVMGGVDSEAFYPVLGLNYIQAMELASSTGTGTFYGNNQQALIVNLDM